MNTTPELITRFAQSLEWHKRADGSEYCKLADDRPDWMTALAIDCHNDHMADDGTYKMIWQVAGCLADMVADDMDFDATIYEQLDSLCPVYNHDLKKWEMDCALADESIEQAIDDRMVDLQAKDFSIHTLRMAGWMVAAEGIARKIIDACDKQSDDVLAPDETGMFGDY